MKTSLSLAIAFSLILHSCSSKPTATVNQSPSKDVQREVASGFFSTCTDVIRKFLNLEPRDHNEIGNPGNPFGFLSLSQITSKKFAGLESPGWKNVDDLEKVVALLKNKRGEFENDDELFAAIIEAHPRAETVIATLNRELQKTVFDGPGHIANLEIRYYFRSKLEELNNLLPKQLKIHLVELPKRDELLAKVRADGIDYVDDLEKGFEELLPTSGYNTYKEFQQAIDSHVDSIGKVAQLIRDEDIELAMHRPENARWWVPKVGFHNQHVTGSSKGYMGQKGRNAVEAGLSRRTYDDYAEIDNDLKPKYGLLRPKTGSDLKAKIPGYGNDVYIMDMEKVRNRLTWTPGDSLNRLNQIDQSWRSGGVKEATSWDDLFIPWQYRELMSPLLSNAVENRNTLSLTTSQTIADGIELEFKNRRSGSVEYLEIQIWGPLRITDVKKFIFLEKEPSGDFLQILKDNNIEIFDGRGRKDPVPWTAPES
jgi:hypothetical protein